MTTPPPASPPAAPKWKPLDACQRRVLGVLIEKAKTTPATYPITVNAIVVGCNQKNNRAPLMTLEAFDVEKALSELGALGAVSEIDWLGRVAKYKHHGHEWFGVSRHELAVMAELLLRGEQALGELRARAARMEPIADLADLRPIVDALIRRGLMIELTAPGRGQVVSHNLYLPPELAELRAQGAGGARAPQHSPAPPQSYASPPPRSGTSADPAAEIAQLRAEVATLRERISALEARVKPATG